MTAAFLVAALTLIIYLPTLQNDFVNWDDDKYVYENPYIHSLDFRFLKWSFSFHTLNWHPLTWLSHAIDYAMWGLNPMGHHLSSIILHSVNTFLLSILIVYLIINVRVQESSVSKNDKSFFTRAVITGVATALLFGIHPIHVESVAWVAERKDVLSTFFMLMSLILYNKHVVQQEGNKHSFYYISSLIFFILALMSKPMAMTLPVILVILDIYPFQRFSFRKSIRTQKKVVIEKIPFFFLSLVSAILTIMAQHSGGAIKSLELYPLPARIAASIKGLCFYLGKMVFPVSLSPYYPLPKSISSLSLEYLFPIILVVVISVFCAWAWKIGQKVFATVWAYYIVTLLPVIGIIQVGEQAAADRYSYFPSIGPFLLIGLGISLAWEKSYSKKGFYFISKKLIILTLISILSLLSMQTLKQIKIWSNSLTLWSHELTRYPDVWIAYYNRANAFTKLGAYKKALEDLDKAITYNPKSAKTYYVRAINYVALEDYQKTLDNLNKAIQYNPKFAKAYYIRANVFIKMEDNQKALKDLDKAIELKSDFIAEAYGNRCGVYKELGNYQQAINDCSRAIEIDPENFMAYNNRGLSYYALGKVQEAIMDYSQAISLNPGYAVSYFNRGNVYLEIGKNDEALMDFQKAASLDDKKTHEFLKKKGIKW